MKNSDILITEQSADYELLDSGEGEKLERFGGVILSRPDPQALWAKKLTSAEWRKADGHFTREEKQGDWSLDQDMPSRWPIALGGLKFYIKPTAFKHVGIFPEQVPNWMWLEDQIKNEKLKIKKGNLGEPSFAPRSSYAQATEDKEVQSFSAKSDSEIEVLNLFGYTGGATLACAQAGAKVVHIDGSKAAITWARENAELSGLSDKPVRWILEDARTFVAREIKRGRQYDGIIMDPPSFGHGPDNEIWKIEEDFLPLVNDCFRLLKDKPLFFLLNGYAAGYSALAYENILLMLTEKYGGKIEAGELAIRESSRGEASTTRRGLDEGRGEASRLLPCGIFARWSGAR